MLNRDLRRLGVEKRSTPDLKQSLGGRQRFPGVPLACQSLHCGVQLSALGPSGLTNCLPRFHISTALSCQMRKTVMKATMMGIEA